MPKSAYIVIGLGFGDEGKGLVTDAYCAKFPQSITIRFNGGQQAGHTVWHRPNKKHVFSNFGAGTLRGIPTFWSRYCTFSPGFFIEELSLLKISPKFFIDRNCPVTTHYDILYNRIIEKYRGKNKHGSCGLGFGATMNRHNELSVKLVASDLLDTAVCMNKLGVIKEFYDRKVQSETSFLFSVFNHDAEDKEFEMILSKIEELNEKGVIEFADESQIFNAKSPWKTYIFEGAQGVLLDVNFGFRPFVTKSNTTSQNAIDILNRNFRNQKIDVNIVYVSRAYHTRHGAGPFRKSNLSSTLKNISNETNVHNQYQDNFRVSPLDLDLLNYAIKCDQKYSNNLPRHLVLTCLDQQANPERIPVFIDGSKHFVSYDIFPLFIDCDFETINYSFSRFSEDLTI